MLRIRIPAPCIVAIAVASCGFSKLPPLRLERIAGEIGKLGEGEDGTTEDGTAESAHFKEPWGVAIGRDGVLYVADSGNNRVRRIGTDGKVTTMAAFNGVLYYGTHGVAVDSTDNVYVAHSAANKVDKTTVDLGFEKVTGPIFSYPMGVAVDASGNLTVADAGNNAIRTVPIPFAEDAPLLAGGTLGSNDGDRADAGFNYPTGVAIDDEGTVYVADNRNHTIRKIATNGTVTTLAGRANAAGYRDGTGDAARFNEPTGVAVDGDGNVYVADSKNSTIRKITPDGVTTTIAGDGEAEVDEVVLGVEPRFAEPHGIAIDGDSLIISDSHAILRLRHVVP